MPVRHTFHTGRAQKSRPRAFRRAAAGLLAIASVVALGTGTAAAAPSSAPGAPVASSADTAPPSGTQVRLRIGPNRAWSVTTEARRPAAVLRESGVTMTPHDEIRLVRRGRAVESKAKRVVRTGDAIKVVRIGARVKVTRNTVKQRTVTRTTGKLAPGRRKVVSRGHHGIAQKRVVRWIRNGRHVDTDVTRRIVRAPAPRRVLVGARVRSVPGTNHLNWGALANCEASGNPHAVNPAGYYGLYQFNVGTWRSVGGKGMPHQASAAEQTYRAKVLYSQRGRSPWPHCGRLL
ncbi:resuscitation-promoting factor [Nocardioides dongkuii]|uniref:resuscitation-promoting factor n=1 Tax=Nocardioides dongkuii TaxID=2760089 RepID=UPI0015FBB954|nr:transglycosylase family protein [Nocardioides dongkuii]